MNLYSIEFRVDTGYEYLIRECTIMAGSEREARKKLENG